MAREKVANNVGENSIRVEDENRVGRGRECCPSIQQTDLDCKKYTQRQQRTHFAGRHSEGNPTDQGPSANHEYPQKHAPEGAPKRRNRVHAKPDGDHVATPKNRHEDGQQGAVGGDRLARGREHYLWAVSLSSPGRGFETERQYNGEFLAPAQGAGPSKTQIRLCMISRLGFFGILTLSLVALPGQVPIPALKAPQAGKVEIFPLGQLKPGMKAIAWTVFEGSEPEPVDIEIIGLQKNAWGPKQDIILAKMFGKALRTGVAGGMSGSPVYIDGKLVGAVSLRIGAFSPDAICGITPIDLMLEINEFDSSRPADAKTPQSVAARQGAFVVKDLEREHVLAGMMMTPIETPLTFSGFQSATLQQFGAALGQMGLQPVMGGASGGSYETAPAADWKTSLRPGQPIVGVLVSGDMSISGLGTVSYNDGKKVLGFGHPFFNMGPLDMPMAKADILTVLSSSFQPNKVGNTTEIVGALRQDRHSGIQGLLGEQAETLPIKLKVRTLAAGGKVEKEKDFRFNVFVNQRWTPFLMTMTMFNSVSGLNEFSDEMTYRLNGKVELDGLPSLSLNNMQTVSDSPMPPSMALASWWGDKFNRLYANNLKMPRVKSVEAVVDLVPERRLVTIESAWMSATEVEPGQEISVKVFLQPHRGERMSRELRLKVPESMSKGEHRLIVSDADSLNRPSLVAGLSNRYLDLPQAVNLINQERANNQLFVSLTTVKPTVFVDDRSLTSLPASVLNVMQSGRGQAKPMLSSLESLEEALMVPLDFVVSGSYSVRFTVR